MQQINDLSAKLSRHRSQIDAAIDRVIASGWLVLGPEVSRFEQSFASYIGADHCVSVASGTDALELALRALGVGPGDKVATVANAGMYTTTALLAIGAQPHFMDVDLSTHLTTLEEVERAVQAGAKVISATHLYGLAIPEIKKISLYCAKNSVTLLEDCAQAHGARVDGICVGAFGAVGCFSFYPTKNLGALGDGGAVVTNDPEIADRVRMLRQYGWAEKYKAEIAGARNSRLDEIQAAVLAELLPGLDASNERRRHIANVFSEAIDHQDILLPPKRGSDYVAHLYVIRSPRRNALRAYLATQGIASEVHYPIPDYRQPLFGERFAGFGLEHTECLVGEILTLPCYPEMSSEQMERVISAVNGWRP